MDADCGTAAAAGRCPRCGDGFACGAAGPGPCPCAGIRLDQTLQARLRQAYEGCLCGRCLTELAAGAPLVQAGSRG